MRKIQHGRAYCPVWCMKHVDYKAPGSLPGAHETLIPFKQHFNTFFFRCSATGRKSECHQTIVTPGGSRGWGLSCKKRTSAYWTGLSKISLNAANKWSCWKRLSSRFLSGFSFLIGLSSSVFFLIHLINQKGKPL